MAASWGHGLVTAAVVLLVTLGMTSGCLSQAVQRGGGPDCPGQLRFGGGIYTGYRFAEKQPTKPTQLGEATPVCAGKAVPGGPVTIWSFSSESPSQVIGRRGFHRRLMVYVADAVSMPERDRILARLAPRRSGTSVVHRHGSEPDRRHARATGQRCQAAGTADERPPGEGGLFGGYQRWIRCVTARSLSHGMRGRASRSRYRTHRTASVEPSVSGRSDPGSTTTS